MTTPTNSDGWTSEPPTVAGVYEFRRYHDCEPVVFRINEHLLYRNHIGFWRRLVPAVEVERAYYESVEQVNKVAVIDPQYDFSMGDLFSQSRAKKVMEGTEQ